MPKILDRVQITQKPTETALDALWRAYLRAARQNAERSLKTPPTAQEFSQVSVYFPSSTTENSGEGVAQSAELVQTLDYYPFGSIRVNNQAANFNERKKFTGYEFDSSTGLNYAGARYQNPDHGRFVSQDPASRDNPGQFAVDPQQMNMYSYGRNNPLVLVDRDGQKVELVTRPVAQRGAGMFGHAFLRITPAGSTIGSVQDSHGIPVDAGSPFTLSAFRNDAYQLYKEVNGEPSADDCNYCASISVSPPHGVSEADFDRNVVSSYNSLPTVLDTSYGASGYVRLTGSPNSNNAATSYLMGAGVSQSQINSYQQQLYSDNKLYTPGLGQSAFAPTFAQSAQNKLSSMLDSLRSALNKLQETLQTYSSK